MAKAKFSFTQNKNSFHVVIENLELLDVVDIKKIQKFVDIRHGYFDFDSYSFTIQKRIDYSQFCKLIINSDIDAVVIEKFKEIKKQNRINYGKYKGMLYGDIPDSYLLWLKNNYKGKDEKLISNEIKARNI